MDADPRAPEGLGGSLRCARIIPSSLASAPDVRLFCAPGPLKTANSLPSSIINPTHYEMEKNTTPVSVFLYGLRSSRRPDKTLRRSQGCRERQTAGFRERGRQGHDRRHSDRRTRQIRTRPARRRDDAGGQLRGLRHAGGGDQGAPAHRRLPSEILPSKGTRSS